MAEVGVVVPEGIKNVAQMEGLLGNDTGPLTEGMLHLARMLLSQTQTCSDKLTVIEKDLRRQAREDVETARLMTRPGIGPITAMAIQAFTPDMHSFENGRHFKAGRGLVPKQSSTADKPRLRRISKMGQRVIRRLLITGGAAVVRWCIEKGVEPGPWLGNMLARKPKMLVVVALTKKMARMVWAMLSDGENYRKLLAVA